MKKLKISAIIYVVFIIAFITGEVMCIYKAIKCDWKPIGKAEVIYTVSAFTGIGAVVGWMDIEDKK